MKRKLKYPIQVVDCSDPDEPVIADARGEEFSSDTLAEHLQEIVDGANAYQRILQMCRERFNAIEVPDQFEMLAVYELEKRGKK